MITKDKIKADLWKIFQEVGLEDTSSDLITQLAYRIEVLVIDKERW